MFAVDLIRFLIFEFEYISFVKNDICKDKRDFASFYFIRPLSVSSTRYNRHEVFSLMCAVQEFYNHFCHQNCHQPPSCEHSDRMVNVSRPTSSQLAEVARKTYSGKTLVLSCESFAPGIYLGQHAL